MFFSNSNSKSTSSKEEKTTTINEQENFLKDYIKSIPNELEKELPKSTDKGTSEAKQLLEKFKEAPLKVILEEGERYNQNNSNKEENNQNFEPSTFIKFQKEEKEDTTKDLKDLVDNFKTRKERIKEMALENCSEYEGEVYHCLRNGSWLDRLKMCSEQYTLFWNCVSKQKEVLEHIGYAKHSNTKAMDLQLAEAGYDIVEEERLKAKESKQKENNL